MTLGDSQSDGTDCGRGVADVDGDRLDRLEAQLDDYQDRLADHEAALAQARETLADCENRDTESTDGSGTGLAAGGLLAALGLAATGTASADAQGQVGTDAQPVETVHVAALDGPLTDGERFDSLVGNGLTVENGELTLSGGN